jgi:hypothetical protein
MQPGRLLTQLDATHAYFQEFIFAGVVESDTATMGSV